MPINVKTNKMIYCVLYFLLKSLLIMEAATSGSPSDQIKIGAVLSTQGSTSAMNEAYQGYKLFVDLVNDLNGGKGMQIPSKTGTPTYFFKFNFTRRDDFSDPDQHDLQVNQLLHDEKVHFMFGSHPTYALRETELTNDAGVYNLHCCVGPDSYYQQNHKYVFGIQASNTQYTKLLIKTLAMEGIRKYAFAYEDSDEFTKTTCKSTYDYAAELIREGLISSIEPFDAYNKNDDKDVFMREFAKKIKNNEIEAVFGCFHDDEGRDLVNAIHDINYPLKAFFVTVGPTKQEWIHSFDQYYRADNLLSAAQWHKELDLKDDMFGSTFDYIELFQHKYNLEIDPTYMTAGASAMGYVLYEAFQKAFKKCDLTLTNGDIDELLFNHSAIVCDDGDVLRGYDRIRNLLKNLDIMTFFGRVKFDHNQRNMGLEPVTTQVFYTEDDFGVHNFEIDAVLPLDIANAVLKVPAKNYYKKDCPSGYFQNGDDFDGCVPCEPGKISFDVNAEHCDSCHTGSWNNKEGQSECNLCPKGTTTITLGSTSIFNCTCIIGYYHPNGNNMGEECIKCPVGAECRGYAALPYPLPGYWCDPSDASVMYKCDPSSLCEGGEDRLCKTGYTGRLCTDCAIGYFSLFDRCRSCIGTGWTIIMIILMFICWYFMNMTVSRNVSSVEMLLNWAQLANTIGDVDLEWPSKLSVLFGIANIVDFDVDIIEPSCIISWSYTQNLIVQLLLPFLMSCMAAFGFLSSYFLYKLSTWRYDNLIYFSKKYLRWLVKTPDTDFHLTEKWDNTLAAFLASIEVTFLTICKYCFDSFKCQTISGKSVLKASPDIECGTTEHIAIQILGSFGILIYVILYTVSISLKLYSLKFKQCFSDPTDLRRFGFLYKKFEIEYYFTPIIIIIRKLLFVLILVFLNNPAFQAGAMAIVINVSLMIHVYSTPYIDTYLDCLFSFLLITLMFLAFGGLMFSSDLLSGVDRDILEWLVLSAFFVLCTVFIVIFVLEIRKICHIRYLKKWHLEAIYEGSIDTDDLSINKLSRILRSFRFRNSQAQDDDQLKANFELLETFHPGIIYNSIKKKKELIIEWDKLTNILSDQVSDQSDTSYLSMEPIAKFWRKFANKFPIIVDFLAVADEDARHSFLAFADSLYRNFYLTNKIITLPIFSVLNWRDYGPMAQWLALCTNEDRRFLMKFMIKLFEASNRTEMAKTLKHQLKYGGKINSVREISMRKLNNKKEKVAKYIENELSPFDHSGRSRSVKSSQSSNLFISHLRQKQTLDGTKSSQEDKLIQLNSLSSTISSNLDMSQKPSLNSNNFSYGSFKNSKRMNSVTFEDKS